MESNLVCIADDPPLSVEQPVKVVNANTENKVPVVNAKTVVFFIC